MDGQTGWLNYLQALLRDDDISIQRIYFQVPQEMVENYWMGISLCVCVCVSETEREIVTDSETDETASNCSDMSTDRKISRV